MSVIMPASNMAILSCDHTLPQRVCGECGRQAIRHPAHVHVFLLLLDTHYHWRCTFSHTQLHPVMLFACSSRALAQLTHLLVSPSGQPPASTKRATPGTHQRPSLSSSCLAVFPRLWAAINPFYCLSSACLTSNLISLNCLPCNSHPGGPHSAVLQAATFLLATVRAPSGSHVAGLSVQLQQGDQPAPPVHDSRTQAIRPSGLTQRQTVILRLFLLF